MSEDAPEYRPAPPPGFTFGRRWRNPYYLAARPVYRWEAGERRELLIAPGADVTDVLHAFDCHDHDLGEIVAKVLRLRRKQGTNIEQELIKVMEHAQAALDRLYAERCED